MAARYSPSVSHVLQTNTSAGGRAQFHSCVVVVLTVMVIMIRGNAAPDELVILVLNTVYTNF
jgi:hypothetical protein